jgi:hypothetical protein
MIKYISYALDIPIEDVWAKTVDYCNNNRGEIISSVEPTDTTVREVHVSRGKSALSWGEEIKFRMTTLSIEKTEVNIFIKLKTRKTKAAEWRVAKKYVKKWAKGFGISPNKLTKDRNDDKFTA